MPVLLENADHLPDAADVPRRGKLEPADAQFQVSRHPAELEVVGETGADAVAGGRVGRLRGRSFAVAEEVACDTDLQSKDEWDVSTASDGIAERVVTDAGQVGDRIV
jgi:hypothetical protein